jgi:GTP cyclohydrolase II
MERIETWLRQQQAEARAVRQRPLVTLSYAQTLDGSLAARRGEPLPISGPESLVLTHRLRAAHQAILVGAGTVLADNPSLTVRLAEGVSPQPIVLDSRVSCPPAARLLQAPRPQPVLLACLPEFAEADSAQERRESLLAAGAQLLPVAGDAHGRLSLPALLDCLGQRQVRSLMVEGGAQVISSFLAAGLADVLVLTTAPFFAGGLAAVEKPLPEPRPRLHQPQYTQLGDDLIVWGKLAPS